MQRHAKFLSTLAGLALAAAGCDITLDIEETCTPAEVRCDGEAIVTCGADGRWQEPQACPTGEACMLMDGGMTHCMAPQMSRAPRAIYLGTSDAGAWWVAAVSPTDGTTLAVTEIAELAALSGTDAPGWGDAVVGPDGRRVFANARSIGRVLVLDADTLAVEAVLEVGPTPTHIYNPNHGNEIWTHSDVEGSFYIIDAETLDVAGPLSAALTASGHGKLVYGEGLGDAYYATNTNDPGVFPIDGAARTAGDIINVCGVPCEDDPATVTDETLSLCGGTHDKGYNPATDWVFIQCTGGRGFSFIDAGDDTVIEDMRPVTGSVAQSPDQRVTLIIDGKRAADQVQIWNTTAAGHDGLNFDGYITVDAPSARGVQFRADGAGWQAWIPETGGDGLVIADMTTYASERIIIGPLTAPPGAHHFSRYAAIGSEALATYDDAGVVVVATDDRTVTHGDALPGDVGRVVYIEDAPATGGHDGDDEHAGHDM